MPYFTLHRDRTISTLSGHIIAFKKDEPTWVPPVAVQEALGIGAVPQDKDFVLPEEDVSTKTDAGEVLDPTERKAKIIEAFELMISRNDRDDFTAGGKPHPRSVSKIVGFTVDAKENGAVWNDYVQEKADA